MSENVKHQYGTIAVSGSVLKAMRPDMAFADALLKEVYGAKLSMQLNMSRTLWSDPRSRSFMYWPAAMRDCPPLEARIARRIKRFRSDLSGRISLAKRALRGDDLHEGCDY